jgi:hypothetical protein
MTEPTALEMEEFYLRNAQRIAHDSTEPEANQQIGRDRAVAAHTRIQQLRNEGG